MKLIILFLTIASPQNIETYVKKKRDVSDITDPKGKGGKNKF